MKLLIPRAGRSPRLIPLLILLCPLIYGCAPSGPPQAVFLIVVDTLRPDRLSCYGYDAHSTQHIDALAERGVLFTRAQSAASWTVPSMGAIMASLYPSQLGLVEQPAEPGRHWPTRVRRKQSKYTLRDDVPSLPEIMSKAGFATVAFVNQPFINSLPGFTRGFDEWCQTIANNGVAWHSPAQDPHPKIDLPEGTELGQADAAIVESFVDWMSRLDGRKPFVWLHLLKPHWPYMPATRYMAGRGRSTDPSDLYDGEIRNVDDLLGRVLDTIDRHVGLDRSLVIFTSDHGEEFGEHGGIEHGHTLHDEVLHVPLVVAGPALPRGKRSEAYVRGVDIFPTILQLLDIETPPNLEGESLFEGRQATNHHRRVYAEGMLYGATERSLIRDGVKLMYNEEGESRWALYDVAADPHELANVAARDTAQTRALREEMQSMAARFASDYAKHGGQPPPDDAEDERVRRSMRALGYIK